MKDIRLKAWNYIVLGYDLHDGKSLWQKRLRRFELGFRDREEDQLYFNIVIRGNWIYGYRYRWVEVGSNQGVNAFMAGLTYGFSGDKMPEYKKDGELVLKHPIGEYTSFIDSFKDFTPTLGWWEDALEELRA